MNNTLSPTVSLKISIPENNGTTVKASKKSGKKHLIFLNFVYKFDLILIDIKMAADPAGPSEELKLSPIDGVSPVDRKTK